MPACADKTASLAPAAVARVRTAIFPDNMLIQGTDTAAAPPPLNNHLLNRKHFQRSCYLAEESCRGKLAALPGWVSVVMSKSPWRRHLDWSLRQ